MQAELLGAGYADRLHLDRGEADPLDLASANERLYNSVFPGYNNAVRFIRVYSALAWMAARVQQYLKRNPPATTDEADAIQLQAMQKMELVLVWANQKRATLAGIRRRFPEEEDREVTLRFSEWDNGASLMAAVQYGPSITNGLRFLDSNWVCTHQAGVRLAQAFAANLGDRRTHQWLADVKRLKADRRLVNQLDAALDVTRPSPQEQEEFAASFFPQQPPAADTKERDRWESLHLVFNTIRRIRATGGTATETQIRQAMARGVTELGDSVLLPGLEQRQAAWAVLQLRQLQRFSCESLLSMVMGWVRAHDGHGLGPEDCADAVARVGGQSLRHHGIRTCEDLRGKLLEFRGRHASFYAAAAGDPGGHADVFRYLEQLRSAEARTWYAATPAAERNATALAFCALETSHLRAQDAHARVLGELSVERGSLTALEKSFGRLGHADVEEWIRHLVLDWIFARYSEVAVNRASVRGGKLRFDFTCDEAGLQLGSSRRAPFQPSIAKDKLQSTLALCVQCGFLAVDRNGGYRLTSTGTERVRGIAALHRGS